MQGNPSPLKRIMLAEGRRQTWLAEQIGKDPADVNRIINRGLIPTEATQRAIAEALDRTVDELWPDLTPADPDSKAAA